MQRFSSRARGRFRSRSRFTGAFPSRAVVDGRPQTTYVVRRAAELFTATGFDSAGASAGRRSCIVGKDITRFHSIIWPAMLRRRSCRCRSGWAHGFVLLGGERFSKSAGVRLTSTGDRPVRCRLVPLFPPARCRPTRTALLVERFENGTPPTCQR
jgi:hypothetical protein